MIIGVSNGFSCTFDLPLGTSVCTPGEYHAMPDNPCKDCMCGSDGRPTGDCREIACSIPLCPEGQLAKPVPGKCCEFNCVNEGKTSNTRINRRYGKR